jgi:hypothetical protein
MQLNTYGIAAPQCGNYDDALVADKTRAAPRVISVSIDVSRDDSQVHKFILSAV